jgi:hypothetical protein
MDSTIDYRVYDTAQETHDSHDNSGEGRRHKRRKGKRSQKEGLCKLDEKSSRREKNHKQY